MAKKQIEKIAENGIHKKIFKIAGIILIISVVLMFLSTYGLNFIMKLRCASRTTVNKMIDFCDDNGLRLKDMRFEDGLCLAICGK